MANRSNSTTHEKSYLPWLVCFSAGLFFFYEFIQMNMFNVITPDLMVAFNVNALSLGRLSAYCFYATILFLFPAGLMLDRFSTRKIILIALLLSVFGTFMFSISQDFALARVFRFMTGIGSAFCFLSSVRLASRWFKPEQLAFIIGLIVMLAMTGGMFAQKPLAYLNAHLGWRHTLWVVTGMGLFITLLNYLFVRDYPPHSRHHPDPSHMITTQGYVKSMTMSYLKLSNWYAGVYAALMNLPIVIIGSLWGSIYLQQTYLFTTKQAASVTSMLFLGSLIGSPIAGWVSDRIGRRRLPMVIGCLLALAIVAVILYQPGLTYLQLQGLMFLLGFITSTQVITYPTVAETNSPELTATSVSVVSLSTQVGFAVFQPLFGFMLDNAWSGLKVDGVPFYSAAAYHNALLIIPLGFILALIAAILMKETYCHRIVK